jgi:hypothetical protein
MTTTTTTTNITAGRTTRPFGLALGSVTAGALVVAGVWNALLQANVTMSAPPDPTSGATLEGRLHAYYAWYAASVGQQRGLSLVAMVGVSGLLLLAHALQRRHDSDQVLSRVGAIALATGALLWLGGALVDVGTHRAVGLMATHGNDLQAVNAIAFTSDLTVQAFSTAAFLLMGLGMVAIGVAPVRGATRRWAVLSMVSGVAAIAVAAGYVKDSDFVMEYVLGALAAVLVPLWALWTGRLVDHEAPAD